MEFLHHLWQSAIVLSMFYGVYVLFLRKDTLFVAKRHYFLVGILVAALFPFVEITQTIRMETPIVSESPIIANSLPPISEMTAQPAVVENPIDWTSVFLAIYFLGVLVLLVRMAIQCLSLMRLIHSNRIHKKGNYRFVKVSDPISPFSFFRYIVYNPELHSQEELEMILQHEKIHVAQWHSLDILLGNFMQIAQWLNPFSWLYKRSMEENLEFIADGKTVDRVASKKQYQLTMVKTSAAWHAPSLTIQFYQSFIKKRIVMLNKQHSKKRNALKAMIILPLLAIFLWGFNVKQVVQYQEPESKTSVVVDTTESTMPFITETPEEEEIEEEEEIAESPAFDLPDTEVEATAEPQEVPNTLYIINGREIRKNELPENQEISIQGSIEVYEPEEAVEIYGAKGSEGVIVIEGNVSPTLARTERVERTESNERMETPLRQVAQFRYRIHKNSTDSELKRIKDELREEHDIDLSYTVVRNGSGEITSINMSYSGDRRNGSYNVSEDDDTPIEEFEFYMLDDGETGFYSEASRLRREERMRARLAEMEERQVERLARRSEELTARVEERERRVEARGEEAKARTAEMKERSKEMKERQKELRNEMKERRKEVKERSKEMRDRTRSLARSGSGENVYVFSDHDRYVRIHKNTSDTELENMKSEMAAKGVTFNYKKVKRNSRGEITSIKVEVKDGKGRSQTSIRSDTDHPIEEMIIEY